MLSVFIYLVGELSVSDGLRSMGGLQVASGWLMQTLLGLFVLASGWLTSILLALFVIASGWFPQILLAFFALCYSQWVAYVDFAGIFCYSQGVVCTDPLTLCVLSVGALRSSFCFLLVLFCFTCSASGGLRILLLLLFFPFSTARLGSACLAASRTQGLCAFLWGLLRFRGEHNGKLIDSYADYSFKSTRL